MSLKTDEQIVAFLEANGWLGATSELIKPDASARRYTRLHKNGKTIILMDTRHVVREQTVQFYKVAKLLRAHGLSAPKIYAKNKAFSLLLVEDFGDALFARLMAQRPELEEPLYRLAIDMLLRLRSLLPSEKIPLASAKTFKQMLDPFFETYLLDGDDSKNKKLSILSNISTCLAELDGSLTTVALRDCHSENLLLLSDREGIATVGLLDFQDAFCCHPAYDLVSLLQDARRDLSENLECRLITYYLSCSKDEKNRFMRAYRCLGLIRNLRILGVFEKLICDEGQSFYASLIPRVKRHVEITLQDPSLSLLRDDILAYFRAPKTLVER